MGKNKRNVRRVILRLYRQFDIDLIYVMEMILQKKSNSQAIIKGIIRRYINGNLDPNENDIPFENTGAPVVLRRKIQYHLALDCEKDRDIIEWLDTIAIGYRNTAIKSIFRGSLPSPCLYPCLASTRVRFVGDEEKEEYSNE